MRALKSLLSAGLIAAASTVGVVAAPAIADEDGGSFNGRAKHVLLISIDGFHAVDLATCLAADANSGGCPNLARLVRHGISYTNASTTKPSDSFPGMLAQVTGGTSKSTGLFYDDSYDRTFFAPGSGCAGSPGTEMNIAEPIDTDLHQIDGGVPAALTGKNSGVAIDPVNLPEDARSGCHPVWPHNLVRVNTIFGVLHARGLRTAWSDKHPAYDILNGPGAPNNGPGASIDDFFAPEINSDLSAANVAQIASLGLTSTAPAPATDPNCPGPNCGSDFTSTLDGIQYYDGIKVQAIINEINGFDHTGKHRLGTPAIFGMNFQAVSVGQKLKGNGYFDAKGTPSAGLAGSIAFVDRSIGQFLTALDRNGLTGSTVVIVSAKHGQSPIDPNRRNAISDGGTLTPVLNSVNNDDAFHIADDVVLEWLKPSQQADTDKVAAALSKAGATVGVGEVISGQALKLRFQDPATDSRTPDVIVNPNVGTIYTGGSKLAEHGGFNEDDVHVALVVSHPDLHQESINTAVQTTQIAPTILKLLGLDPSELEAVQAEETPVLPDF